MNFWQKYSSARGYCYIQHPHPPTVEGKQLGGGATKIVADDPCIKKLGHDGPHRDLLSREWEAVEPEDT